MLSRIYKITNIKNNKIYIGFTIQNIKDRWYGHISDTNNGSNLKIHNAIRKHGKESFRIEEIYTSKDKDHCLNIMEEYFIKHFDSVNNGYNITYGGEHHNPNEKSKWYNNGTEEKMFKGIPSQGFKLGRLFPEGSKKTKFKKGSKPWNIGLKGMQTWNKGLKGLKVTITEEDRIRRRNQMLLINQKKKN